MVVRQRRGAMVLERLCLVAYMWWWSVACFPRASSIRRRRWRNGDLKVCGNRHVEQAVSLIEQNLSRPYTVRELVQRLNTSERVLYAKACAGLPAGFTGIDDPYEAPESPEMAVDTEGLRLDIAAARVLAGLERLGYLH